MLNGLDCLGLARFSKEALDAFPAGFALGVFANTFGDAMPAVKHLISSGRCSALRVHLLWSDAHAYSEHDVPTVKSLAARWGELAGEHKNVPIYISPFCEHNVANPDRYLDIVKEHAPHCEPVNSVMNGAMSAKHINEVHGSASHAPGSRYIFSYDGSDMLECDSENIKKRHERAIIQFGWTANFNGNTEADAKNRVPRDQRKAWPSNKLIQSVVYVMKKHKGITQLPPRWLWKSHAEDTGSGDTRTNKPVLISPIKASSVELLSGGRVAASGSYYGPYVDGRFRYYFHEWGYEIGERTGGTTLDLRLDGKVYGRVNPAFRDGSFR